MHLCAFKRPKKFYFFKNHASNIDKTAIRPEDFIYRLTVHRNQLYEKNEELPSIIYMKYIKILYQYGAQNTNKILLKKQ